MDPFNGWTAVDLIIVPTDISHARPGFRPDEIAARAAPAPNGHVGDRVAFADHPLPAGEMIVQDTPVPFRFELITGERIWVGLRREVGKSAKLNGLNPESYLATILDRMARG